MKILNKHNSVDPRKFTTNTNGAVFVTNGLSSTIQAVISDIIISSAQCFPSWLKEEYHAIPKPNAISAFSAKPIALFKKEVRETYQKQTLSNSHWLLFVCYLLRAYRLHVYASISPGTEVTLTDLNFAAPSPGFLRSLFHRTSSPRSLGLLKSPIMGLPLKTNFLQ